MSRWVPSTHRFSHLAGNHRTTCFGRPGYITNGQKNWMNRWIGNRECILEVSSRGNAIIHSGKSTAGFSVVGTSLTVLQFQRKDLPEWRIPAARKRSTWRWELHGHRPSQDTGEPKLNKLTKHGLSSSRFKFKHIQTTSSCSWPRKSFGQPSFPMLSSDSFPQPDAPGASHIGDEAKMLWQFLHSIGTNCTGGRGNNQYILDLPPPPSDSGKGRFRGIPC